MSQASAALVPDETPQRTLFGHPLGLYVLFFTEMWERFSFYGMKTLMVLYMLNHFFWSQKDSSRLLGLYAFFAYGVNPIGGFIADRILGARKAVFIGGLLIVVGQFLLVKENLSFFYAGLAVLVCGVGLLKPNISTQVGNLYKPGDPRRDGAFTIFYMGINLGALIGPLICDWLRVNYGFGYGFGAAGVGMILGLIVYAVGQKKLVEFRQSVSAADRAPGATSAAQGPPSHVVRDRVIVLLVIFAFVFLFWTAFEQSPNAMLVWADKHTNLRPLSAEPLPVSLPEAAVPGTTQAEQGRWYEFSITSGQTQSFNPFFIITLAPVLAFVWLWLDKRGLQPSTPTKMVMGVAAVALSFLVMWPAAFRENGVSSAPLAELPSGLDLSEFGATRLTYDTQAKMLRMNGVLPDNDRFRLLAETAPDDFKQAVARLVKKSADKAAQARADEKWEVAEVLAAVPPGLRIAGDDATRILRWDAGSKTLTALDEIKDRAKAELLATAAAPRFKAAVDKIYLDSSRYRVSVWWLIAFFLVLTCGELCLSPVGLSLVTKLAPPKHVGLFMGGWFFFTALSEYVAQVFGAWWGKMPPTTYFMIFVGMCGGGAFLMSLLVRPLKRMMHGVQ
jgi:POT family proton-dependent oligopeptide transporter